MNHEKFDEDLFQENKSILLSKIKRKEDDAQSYTVMKAFEIAGKDQPLSVRVRGSKESLEIGTDYTLVVLPVGPDGGLGNYIVHEFCTKPVNTDGVAVVDASVTDIGYTYISISAELDENTECLYYYLYNPSDPEKDSEKESCKWDSFFCAISPAGGRLHFLCPIENIRNQ